MAATLRMIFAWLLFQNVVQASDQRFSTERNIPSPRELPSRPEAEWCEIVSMVLANPNASPDVKREYVRVGQTMDCEVTRFMPRPPSPITPPKKSAGDFCQNGMDLLANPYVDPFVKSALLTKMRNRGCLR